MPLKITKRPNSQNWYIRGAVRGVQINETTGTDNKEIAEAIRVKRESELLEQSVFGKAATVTFEDAVLEYLESGGSPRYLGTIREDGRKTLLLGAFDQAKLKDIKQADLDRVARELYPTALPETRNRQVYTPFIAAYNAAVHELPALQRNWRRPRRKKGTLIKRHTLRAGSSPTNYQKAASFVSALAPAPAMVMTALMYTGMRPIELFNLECHEVFIQDRWIVLSGSKTGAARGLPIHEFVAPLFEDLCRDGGYVFKSYRGKPYKADGSRGGQIQTAIVTARKKTGISDISPNTSRHTFSTQLVLEGVHPHIKDQILGHAVTDMSRNYTHVPDQRLIDEVNKLPVPDRWRTLSWWGKPLDSRGQQGKKVRTARILHG